MSVPLRRRRCRENPRRGAWRGVVTSVTPLPPVTFAFLGPSDESFTVPEGVTLLKKVTIFAAGGDTDFAGAGGAGAGGACAVVLNLAVTPGQVIPCHIAAHGQPNTVNYTWFVDDATYRAQNAQFESPGLAVNCLGDLVFDGGIPGGGTGGGGGGAAGPDGEGADGGNNGSRFEGGAGGGGSGNGTNGIDSVSTTGSIGGLDSAGNPSGGAGADNNNDGADRSGVDGVDNADLGGGGGGGASPDNGGGTTRTGGNGGQPGGGGGGNGIGTGHAIGGDGAIKIEF